MKKLLISIFIFSICDLKSQDISKVSHHMELDADHRRSAVITTIMGGILAGGSLMMDGDFKNPVFIGGCFMMSFSIPLKLSAADHQRKAAIEIRKFNKF